MKFELIYCKYGHYEPGSELLPECLDERLGEDKMPDYYGKPLYVTASGNAYIDPSGLTPDGYEVPLELVNYFIDEGWLVINERDNPDDETLGYGLQVFGWTDREEERHLDKIDNAIFDHNWCNSSAHTLDKCECPHHDYATGEDA